MTSIASARCFAMLTLPPIGSGGVLRLQFDGLADQARQAPADEPEQLVDVRAQEAGAELVDQRVVGRQVQRLREHLRLVARQRHDLLEVRCEQRKVILLLGLEPARLGSEVARASRGHENQRHGDRMVAFAAHLAQVRAVASPRVATGSPASARSGARPWRRQQRVAFGLERRQLLAAHVGAAAGHHDRRSPSAGCLPRHGTRGDGGIPARVAGTGFVPWFGGACAGSYPTRPPRPPGAGGYGLVRAGRTPACA